MLHKHAARLFLLSRFLHQLTAESQLQLVPRDSGMCTQQHAKWKPHSNQYAYRCVPPLQVAREVHTLIGGEVNHASTDEDDLSDDIKVVRRLAALNLLAAKGWTPTVAFWEVRAGCQSPAWACVTPSH
jgi:hypothetical protein